MEDRVESYLFHSLREITTSPVHLMAVAIEEWSDGNYYWGKQQNQKRRPYYLFQYTLSGSGTLKAGGVSRSVREGQGFFLQFPCEEEYYFDEDKNDAPWKFIYIAFEGSGIFEYYDLITKKFGQILKLEKTSSCIEALIAIFQMARSRQINDSFTGDRLTFDFLCRMCYDFFHDKTKYSDTVHKAIQIMEYDFSTLDGVLEVADRLGISQSHLSRLFMTEMNTTPIAYLTKVRLEKATTLLSRSRNSVDEIARSCGFSCGNYFSKVFRAHMGVSPLKYRNNSGNILYEFTKI